MHFKHFVRLYPFQIVKKRLYWVDHHDLKQTYFDIIKYTCKYDTCNNKKEIDKIIIDNLVNDIENIKKDLNKILQYLYIKS